MLHTDRQTDRQTYMMRLIVAFHNYSANEPVTADNFVCQVHTRKGCNAMRRDNDLRSASPTARPQTDRRTTSRQEFAAVVTFVLRHHLQFSDTTETCRTSHLRRKAICEGVKRHRDICCPATLNRRPSECSLLVIVARSPFVTNDEV